MHDSCLHFIPGVSNPDQGKCITLELYFTFELSADAKTQHLRLHLTDVIWLFRTGLYVTLINTLYNVCSVHRGMFSTSGGVQYIGGIS